LLDHHDHRLCNTHYAAPRPEEWVGVERRRRLDEPTRPRGGQETALARRWVLHVFAPADTLRAQTSAPAGMSLGHAGPVAGPGSRAGRVFLVARRPSRQLGGAVQGGALPKRVRLRTTRASSWAVSGADGPRVIRGVTPRASRWNKELCPSCGARCARAVPCRQSDIRPWVVSPHRRAGFTEAPNGEEGGNLMGPPPDREALSVLDPGPVTPLGGRLMRTLSSRVPRDRVLTGHVPRGGHVPCLPAVAQGPEAV